jgi:hypothetical protein
VRLTPKEIYVNNDSRFAPNITDEGVMLPESRMEPAVVREAPERESAKPVITERRVRIMLEDNDAIPPTGQFFGINGVGYLLKSNIEALVPVSLVDILNNAVTDRPIVDPVTKQVTGWKKQLRFPYRVLGLVEPDRIAA